MSFSSPEDSATEFARALELSSLITPAHVAHLDVYQPGKPIAELERELGISGAVKVASNENPLGPCPGALDTIRNVLGNLHLYPDAGGWDLRRAVSAKYNVPVESVTLGNGSNDLLYQLVLATTEPTDEVLSHQYAFLSYRLSAQVAGRPFVAAATTPQLSIDVDAMLRAVTPRTKLVIVGTPNNPTGSIVSNAQMAQLLAGLPARCLLVIDEAYTEYAEAWPEIDHAKGLDWARKDARVISLRTFSKIYGLAGLRVGYAVANPSVIDLIGRVTRTFHVSSLAQAGAVAALQDDAFVAKSSAAARATIEEYTRRLVVPGGQVYPSLANFVLVDVGRPSTPTYDALLRKGVITRPMAAWGLPNHIQISIAGRQDVERVIDTCNQVFAQN